MMVSAKSDIAPDTMLVGIGVSPGIAIGEAYLVRRAKMAALERDIEIDDVPAEVSAFREALERSGDQLRQVKEHVRSRLEADQLYIIDAHLMILEDPMLVETTLSTIGEELINAEGALKRTLRKFRVIFDSIEDEYLRERRSDIEAVGDRVLRNLMGESGCSLGGIDRQAVVVAHDLSPADTMQIDKSQVLGFVTDVGGRTSHTAILARSLAIPAVVGLENATSLVPGNTPLIIDGSGGTVVLNPTPATFREYLKKKQAYEYFEQELLGFRSLSAETTDGQTVALRANIELPDEGPQAVSQGAEGVGLFRTEFLYLGKEQPPAEDEQFGLYRDLVQGASPHAITIRTLDSGGDKFVSGFNLEDETNPALGLRGVRFSLSERKLLMTQLRAILRASASGPIRIMFPMISGVAEMQACRSLVHRAKQELQLQGLPFDDQIAVGAMIETPAAAMIADLLAEQADFFSVGTNDLIQYFLAVDRGNEHVAYLYEPLHPAILRALETVCRAARQAGIPVAMCGEMAAEPLYLPILLALGFTELSMTAASIPRVKRVLRQFASRDCSRLLDELKGLSTALEIAHHLEESMAQRFPDLFGRPDI